MALFTKLFNKDEKAVQVQNEIKSLQIRKESVVSAIQTDIAKLQKEKENVLLQAGTKAYEDWMNHCSSMEGLEAFWKQIQDIETDKKEKEAKKAEMETKYDEEISLLQKDLNQNIPENTGSGMACPKCGAGIKEEDLFCEQCGAKLK